MNHPVAKLFERPRLHPTIRTRLTAAVALLLLLLALVAGLSYRGFQSLSDSAHTLVERQVRLTLLANRANQHAQMATNHLLRLLLTPEREARVPLYAAMDEALRHADQALQQMEPAQAGLHAGAAPVDLEALRQQYGAAFQDTLDQVELDGPRSAMAHFEAHTEPALKRLLAATDQCAREWQEAMKTEVERLTAEAAMAQQRIVWMGVLALLAGAVLAGLLARSITRPVNQAAVIADSIAGGDYATELPPAGHDEIGRMMRALGTMRQRVADREAQISRIAYIDKLTGLPNRARISEDFAQTQASHGALLLIDLDRFSAINKALGHAVGDELVRGVAGRLQAVRGEQDRLARLWGDEFVLWLAGANAEEARASACHIRQVLGEPMTIEGQPLDLEVSMGMALFPEHGTDFAHLLQRADSALRRAKRQHAGVMRASEEDAEPSPEQLGLIGEMRQALALDQFLVFYQPKLDLRSGRITAAEALIRWKHPQRGLVPPGKFIPFAEQTGFIREITPWLVRRVIQDTARWRRMGLDLVVSANLSTHDLLNARLMEELLGWLAQEHLPPAALCLEITESALMDDPARALQHLHTLAAQGIKLAIDDYGSGQASLAYVKNLPVHELKIDREFIAGVATTPKNAAIVRSTVLLCQELGLAVVAEGAEDAPDMEWLKQNGCDFVQGYGVAKPMPGAEFEGWVRGDSIPTPSPPAPPR
jgi:diguanylate cyclase (GGDEF)-like protein